MKRNFFFLGMIVYLLLTGCTEVVNDNTLSKQEKSEGWKLLFDGETTNGWRGYNMTELPAAWSVIDGTLMSAGEGDDIGGDIIAVDEFGIQAEWT